MEGHWIFTIHHYPDGRYCDKGWHCSECNHYSFESARFPDQEYFCHNCGAKMIDKPELIIKEMDYKAEYSWE